MGEREREGLGVVTMRAVVVLLVLGAVAGKDLFEMKDLPDLSKLTHITQVPEELGKAAVEKVEDMPGFGPNDDEAETATPPNWDMNAPDQQALDTELGSVDMALIELSQDQQEQQPAEAPAQKASAEAPITLPPTRAAAIIGKGVLSRECLNNCGGLCRQLCSKFKALKVCNGCVRGCINKCDSTGEIQPNNPYYDPFDTKHMKKLLAARKSLPPIQKQLPNATDDGAAHH